MCYVSPVGMSGHAATRCPNLNDSFPFMQPGWQTEKTPGGFIMIPPQVAMDRRRRKTAADPRGGPASRVRDHVRPRDPGGGAVSTVSLQPMTIDDIFQTVEQSGGGPQLVPSGVSPPGVWTEELWLRTFLDGSVLMMILEYDREWAQCGRRKIECLLGTLSRRMGEGCRSLPGATGSLLPVKFPAAPVLLADGPQLGSWQVAVVRVDETPAGDAPGRKCPRAEQNRQRPIDVSEVTGNVRPVLPAGGSPLAGVVNPAGPDGPVVAGGPVGPCEMPSPHSEKTQEPLEQAVLIQADPAVTLLAQPARMLQGALSLVSLLLLGRCPHLTVTLLAQLARVLQEALSAQMFV